MFMNILLSITYMRWKMINNGFLRVGVAVPKTFLGKPLQNVHKIIELAQSLSDASIVCFPELAITGYSIGDWFNNQQLIDETKEAIKCLVDASNDQVWIVGGPLLYNGHNYNCAYVIQNHKILGIVPKMHLPEYREFYEKRIFRDGLFFLKQTVMVMVNGSLVPFGECIFDNEHCKFGVEICEDLWHINAPNELLYTAGAHIVFNLSASTFHVCKANRRKNICETVSFLGKGAYVYVSSSVSETSSDVIMSGHSIVVENGVVLYNNAELDKEEYAISLDIDIDKINYTRRMMNINYLCSSDIVKVPYELRENEKVVSLKRAIDPLPFTLKTDENKEEVIKAITYALYHRLSHIGVSKVVLGVSGGLDSTLALLMINECFEKYGLDKSGILAYTMPGLGTGEKSKNNAEGLALSLGIKLQTIDIKEEVMHHFNLIGKDDVRKDVTFENIQARYRTLVLMDIANKENAIVCGTSDMSEIALGWSTFNGDQMSMYNLNGGLPKTTIKELVSYFKTRKNRHNDVLQDVLDLPISPELTGSDQKTEDIIGKYEINDFIMYHIFVCGASKSRVCYLLNIVYDLSNVEAEHYYDNFMRRFCRNQFKRLTGPESVKIFEFSFACRSDLHFPGDMKY